MSLVQLIVLIIVLGLIAWLINYLPLPPPFKVVAMVLTILILVLWLLGAVGLVAFP